LSQPVRTLADVSNHVAVNRDKVKFKGRERFFASLRMTGQVQGSRSSAGMGAQLLTSCGFVIK
ncbi:MAG: hypothetical protein RSD48_05695, partial [Oscillospiraceae bacterium]